MPKDKKHDSAALPIYSAMIEARRWRLAAGGFASVSLALVIIIMMLLPLKETEVRYVEFSASSDNFFKVYPSNMPRETLEILGRKALRQYVEYRHARNSIEDIKRLYTVKAMSGQQVWTDVIREQDKWTKESPHIKRNVEIVSDTMLTPNTHQVVFKTIDTDPEGTVVEGRWVATLQHRFVPLDNVTEDIKYYNPLALVVEKYTIDRQGADQ